MNSKTNMLRFRMKQMHIPEIIFGVKLFVFAQKKG